MEGGGICVLNVKQCIKLPVCLTNEISKMQYQNYDKQEPSHGNF